MTESPKSALRPLLSVLFALITLFSGFVVIGQVTGMIGGFLFYDGTFLQWVDEFSHSLVLSEKLRLPLLIMQLCATGFGLILTPWLYLRFIEKQLLLNEPQI